MQIRGRIRKIQVIAILFAICGIIMLTVGIQNIDRSVLMLNITDMVFSDEDSDVVDNVKAPDRILLIIYSIFTALGVGYLLMSYGLLKEKIWSWNIARILIYSGVVFGIVSIIFEILFYLTIPEEHIQSFNLVGETIGNVTVVVLSVIILYLLGRPNIRPDKAIESAV